MIDPPPGPWHIRRLSVRQLYPARRQHVREILAQVGPTRLLGLNLLEMDILEVHQTQALSTALEDALIYQRED